MKRIVDFADPELFVLPVIKYVCKPRGLPANEVHTLFTANCERCGSEVPGGALAIAAIMSATSDTPGPDPSCKKCGHDRMIATMTTLSAEEESLLNNDEFFRRLTPVGVKPGKRQLSPEELDCLFCSPTFVQRYMSLFNFAQPLSPESEAAKDQFLGQLSQDDINRFIEEGRQTKRRHPVDRNSDSRQTPKRWWKLWK